VREKGPVALVTGGWGDLGRAIVSYLDEAHYRVAVVDRRPSDSDLAGSDRVRTFIGDLADLEAVPKLISDVAADFDQPIEVLVNNAGICPLEDLKAIEPSGWRRVFDLNVGAAFFCAQAVADKMPRNANSSIVNIASVAAHVGGIQSSAHYVSSKAALVGLTKSLARLLGPLGIRCNAIAPGPMDTQMTKTWPPETFQSAIGATLFKRPIAVEGVAAAVAFLVSDTAKDITGSVIDIDGGLAFR
jgi:3-oxoacyl-[acyl-carrier protein] reductase